MTVPDGEAASRFLAASGRVLDRRRLERLFLGGEAGPVRDAVAAYRNPDGGFGHGLEPDGRTPASQPFAGEIALRTLDEVDGWDGGLVRGAVDWVAAAAARARLDYPPEPASIARDLFDKSVIATPLDHLAGSQRADGGWTFNWLAWSPAAELEWRGSVTVDALRVLRANGRW